jgi:hypothetical protein
MPGRSTIRQGAEKASAGARSGVCLLANWGTPGQAGKKRQPAFVLFGTSDQMPGGVPCLVGRR